MKKYTILISLKPKKYMHFLPITARPMFEMILEAENKMDVRKQIKQYIKGPFKVVINQIKELRS